MSASRKGSTGRADRVRLGAWVGLGSWVVLGLGCADAALQLAAQQAIDRAVLAEAEVEELNPSRADQLLYRMPLNQARDAHEDGRDEEAKLLADKAYQAAVDVRARREQAKRAIGARMAEVEAVAQVALADPDPGLDKEQLFHEVDKRYGAAKKKLAASDYEGALASADEALTMLKRRSQLFRKARAIQVTPPADESVATPAPSSSPSATTDPADITNAPPEGGSFIDRLRRAATKSGTPTSR